MDVIWLNTQSLVQLLDILLLFILFSATLVVIARLDPRGLASASLGLIYEVKLVDFSSTEQREMILPTLIVDAIELRQAAVSRDDVGVTEQAPHLPQRHGEGLLGLGRLDLLGVQLVPVLQIRVMAQQDVLALFLYITRVLLKIDQISDVNELTERILFHFLLRQVGGTSLGRLRRLLFATSIFLITFLLCRQRLLGLRFGNLALHHAIFVEGTDILRAVLKSERTLSMLEVFDPVSFILASIGVIEGTLAVAKTILPVADIPVPEQLIITAGVEPDVSTEAALQVVFPVA